MTGEFDLLKGVWGDKVELTPKEKALRSRAAIFAVATFDVEFLEENGFPDQLTAAEQEAVQQFTRLNPEPDCTDADIIGNHRLWLYVVEKDIELPIIIQLVTGTKKLNAYGEETQRLMEADPSGVAKLQSLLNKYEDEATQTILRKKDKAQAELTLGMAGFYIDEIHTPMQDEVLSDPKAKEEFEGMPPELQTDFREFFEERDLIRKERAKRGFIMQVYAEKGYVFDENDNLVSKEITEVAGMRLFYERFSKAVDFYLQNFGGRILL